MTDHLDAYVLPTAARQEGDSLIVEATLVFRPGVSGAADGATPNLDFWPRWIAGKLDGLKKSSAFEVELLALDAVDGAIKPRGMAIPGTLNTRLAKAYASVSPHADKAVEMITELWTKLVIPGPDLRNALLIPALQQTPPLHALIMQDGKAAPDLISVQRGDLSHLLKFGRAKIISDRIASSESEKAGGAPATIVPRLPDAKSPWMQRVELPPQETGHVIGHAPDGTPIVAAAAGAVAPAEKSSRDQQLEALRAERALHLAALNKDMAGPRAYAEQVAKAAVENSVGSARKSNGGSNARGAAELAADATKLKSALSEKLQAHFYSGISDATTFDASAKQKDKLETAYESLAAGQDTPENIAAGRWSAVLGLPSLQRVLHLVVDAEITFAHALDPQKSIFKQSGPDFLALRLKCDGYPQTSRFFFSLAKWVRGAAPTIWPCTAEELLATAGGAKSQQYADSIDQRDGVLNLESALDLGGGELCYRFSVDSLDVHAACESEVQRDRAIDHVNQVIADAGSAAPFGLSVDTIAVERKLRTAGVQVIDQWRDSVVVKQFVRTLQHLKTDGETKIDGSALLDAEDLTIGLRLDVASYAPDLKMRWACLTALRDFGSIAE